MPLPDARTARWINTARARRAARHDAWHRAAGDPARYTQIIRGQLDAGGYLYYYDGEDTQPRRSATAQIWIRCARQAAFWTAVFGAMALYIWVAGLVGYM